MTEIGRVNKHKTTHQDGGDDEIVLTGILPGVHKTTHQDAGDDELDLTGLTRSPVFVNRGDPTTVDFAIASFTTDGTWRNLDLSSIVSTAALAVLINVRLLDDAAGSLFQLRKDGNTNTSAVSKSRTQVANVSTDQNYIVPLVSTGIIEYNAANLTWSAIDLCVLGWWI